MVVPELERRATAIDGGAPLEAERCAGAGKIGLLDVQRSRGLAALVAQLRAGLQRPGVPREDFDVDHALAVAQRPDGDVVHRARRADDALGLLDEPHRDAVAALEKQRAPDQLGPRLDVQRVRRAIGDGALMRVAQIEDVVRVDADLAEHGARRLELGERGHFRVRLRGRRQRESDAQAGEPAVAPRGRGHRAAIITAAQKRRGHGR